MKNKIIIFTGDPNSINSELIGKIWKKLNNTTKKNIYLISNYELLKKQFKKLNYTFNAIKIKNLNQAQNKTKLKIIDIHLKFDKPFRVSKPDSSRFVVKSLNLLHNFGLQKNVKAIINLPIDKKLLKKSKIGVTEFFAKKCGIKDHSEVMLIWNEKLAVSPLTTHIDIKDISKNIEKFKIKNKVKTISIWFKKNFKRKPKICILGLNPHNAELREGSEEKKIIIPAISKLKKLGFNVSGPHVSDTLFIKGFKSFDIIIGMFHDQVLTPFKTLFKYDAVNLTLGLKYLRLSPDHGTATNIIGKNKANTTSLLKCINLIKRVVK